MRALTAVPLAAILLAVGGRAFAQDALVEEAKSARARAGSVIAETDGTAQRVGESLRRARQSGDRERASCENAALSKADVASRAARAAAQAASEAYARGDAASARAAMANVLRAQVTSRHAYEASAMCAGDAISAPIESTSVRVVIDPTIPPAK